MFNKLKTVLSTFAVLVALVAPMLSGVNTNAQASQKIMLKTDIWGVNAQGQTAVTGGTGSWVEYDCASGAAQVSGVDVSRIKAECAQAIQARGGNQNVFAYVGNFTPSWGPKQTYYGFWTGSGANYINFASGSQQASTWFKDEAGFNKMYVQTAVLECPLSVAGGNCARQAGTGTTTWTPIVCGQGASVGGVDISELQAACSAKVAAGNYFAYKVITLNKRPSEQKMLGFWTGSAWTDPQTNQAMAWKAL